MQEKKVFARRQRQQNLFAVGPAYKKVCVCENIPTPVKNNGPPLIWPIRVSAAEQDMAFRVLSFKQGIQFYYSAS